MTTNEAYSLYEALKVTLVAFPPKSTDALTNRQTSKQNPESGAPNDCFL